MPYFIHIVLTNMFWPVFRPSLGRCYLDQNTKHTNVVTQLTTFVHFVFL